jgi:hypothetical protein
MVASVGKANHARAPRANSSCHFNGTLNSGDNDVPFCLTLVFYALLVDEALLSVQ